MVVERLSRWGRRWRRKVVGGRVVGRGRGVEVRVMKIWRFWKNWGFI